MSNESVVDYICFVKFIWLTVGCKCMATRQQSVKMLDFISVHLDRNVCCVIFTSRFTAYITSPECNAFWRASRRQLTRRSSFKQSSGLFKTEVPQVPRKSFFATQKSGWSVAEDSGVGYADHVAPNGNVTPPLMLFHIFSCSPRRQPTKQRCFAPQRSLIALTHVNFGFKKCVNER